MNTNDKKVFLKQERAQTDDSLTTERGKTDESLSKFRKSAELETDQKVKNGRDEADEARAQRRSDTDLIRKSERDPKNQVVDQKAESSRFTQRQFDDKTLEAERALMDAALFKERGLNRTVANELLHGEREETDENLSQERKQTDSQVERVSGLLTNEQSSHSLTKAALTTRDEFLAIVSHDLRNPIGVVLSYADLLLEDPPSVGLTKEAKDWIEVIKRNAQTSLRLISDILDMERFAAGKFHLELSQHNIQSLLDQAVESFAQIVASKEISLKAIASSFSSVVNCDAKRIEQVLSNLVGNAIKFTPRGGSIHLSLSQKENALVVSVTDSGQGIFDEEKIRIFDRFAQINNKDRNGLGLGLYISKMIVEAHHGRIWVTSKLGQGSTFSFALPLTS
jgi:signal transduction histidine kinase